MAATPYRPTSFNDRVLSVEKLQQMTNNDQWLFENTPRMRYSYSNGAVIRDSGIKLIAGKTPFGVADRNYLNVQVYFGSFFSASCKPIVSAIVETTGKSLRKLVTVRGMGGEIDYRGMIVHISTQEQNWADKVEAAGWIHWYAMGF